MKKGMPSLPAALKGRDFLITLEICFSEIDMGEGISGGQEASGISDRSASGMGKKNHIFRASAFQWGS
jgi:hypothetical protein